NQKRARGLGHTARSPPSAGETQNWRQTPPTPPPPPNPPQCAATARPTTKQKMSSGQETLNRAYALCGGPEPLSECGSRVAASNAGAQLDGGAVKWTNRRLTARPWGNWRKH